MQYAGYGFLAGVALIVIGAFLHAFSPRPRADTDAPDDPIKMFFWLMKKAVHVLFDTTGKYTAGQRLMAGGMLLCAISGILWLGALAADSLGGDDNGNTTTTDTTTTETVTP